MALVLVLVLGLGLGLAMAMARRTKVRGRLLQTRVNLGLPQQQAAAKRWWLQTRTMQRMTAIPTSQQTSCRSSVMLRKT